MMKLSEIKTWSTEKISQRVFYVLIGLSVVIFLLFFFVGFDEPYIDNPDFNAPLFTDVLIVFMWILSFCALAVAICAMVKTYRTESKMKDTNGIPERKIRRYTWLGTFGCMLLFFLVASSSSMLINGKQYEDWLWLKVSDMFVYTSIILLLVAAGAVIYGATRYIRKDRK